MLFMHPASSMHTIQACLLLYLPDNSMPYQTERALTMQPCSISRFSILQQILFIVFIFSAGIALYISTSAYFFSISKVNGPIYRQIIQGKDLIADILPPPEYIIESYLVALQAQDQTPGKQLETQQKNFDRLQKKYEERHVYWQNNLPEYEEKKLLLVDSYQPAKEFYQIAQSEFFPALAANRREEAQRILKEQLAPRYELHRQAIDRIVELTNKRNAQIEQQSDTKVTTFIWLQVAIVLAIMIGTAMLVSWVIRSIVTTLRFCAAVTSKIAEGDLSITVPVAGRGSVRVLLESLSYMNDQLRLVVGGIADTATQLSCESRQLHQTSRTIADSADLVAQQTSGFASATDQITAAAQEIASGCHLAASSAGEGSALAGSSAESVQVAAVGMGQLATQVRDTAAIITTLGTRSEQISQIIDTIEDIADQTNLLALNAAIEAARAGEQGRGFAVVADEVRALAERTTKATREIATMIKTIQDETKLAVSRMETGVVEVNKGSAASEESCHILEAIRERVIQVSERINAIAVSAEEQTSATVSMNTTIRDISAAVADTAGQTHIIAASAKQLSELTGTLQTTIGRFRLS
jgi:methyl-accepting chemotaxis protein